MAKKSKASSPSNELEIWYLGFKDLMVELREKSSGGLIGKYFVIRDGKIVDQYDTFDTAYRASTEKFKDNRFLIQELLPEGSTEFVFVTG